MKKNIVIYLAIAVLLIAGAIIANHYFNAKKNVSGVIPVKTTVPGSRQESEEPAVNNGSNSIVSDKKQTTVVAATPANDITDLTKPYGTFVSNHHPSLSGDNSRSTIQSVCSTNPGALCTIQFSKDGVIKSLPEQIVGSDGTTLWEWNIRAAGFTPGTWLIKAIAKSGETTLETVDDLKFEVSP